MININKIISPFGMSLSGFHYRKHQGWNCFNIDIILFLLIFCLIGFGLVILYSASNENNSMMVRQFIRLGIALATLIVFAQIPPHKYRVWAPWLYMISVSLLISVLVIGKIGKGAQRWLDLGLFRFQPSELLKLAVPMMVAWYYSYKPLPADLKSLLGGALLIVVPGVLIAKQPDLGTAIMVMFSGGVVLFLAGMSWRVITAGLSGALIFAPILWHYMHDYQRQRVLTFLNPERDPLGSGYHIIQSKIAIGSGGLMGKGWLNGSQSHLHFLPEHATDFIFAVCGEEFGLIGNAILVFLILLITFRCIYIAQQAQDCFTRLLAGSLAISYFIASFINIGMVSGILPVVGLPLPLVSYGGTSMVTLMASFGILMSINKHRIIFTDM